MEKELDNLIQDFKDGNFKSYEKSLEKTFENINQIKTDLEKMLNDELKKYQKDMIKELEFIQRNLKELELEKKKYEKQNLYEEADKNESLALGGEVYLIYKLKEPLAVGFLIALINGQALLALGAFGAVGIGIAGIIHGSFWLYKKFTEKKKYIELIEKEKTELISSCTKFKDNVNSALEEYKKQLEKGIKNFEDILFSKKEGIRKNKEKWQQLYKEFKELIFQLK